MLHQAALLSFPLLATVAGAAPISFTYTGTASGFVGGVSFNDAAFTIQAFGDTSHRTSNGFAYRIIHDSASITIAGLGVAQFSTPTSTAVNLQQGVAVFGNPQANLALIITGSDAAFLSWDMTTSLGPIAQTGTIMQWSAASMQSTLGAVVLTNASFDGTFEASVPTPAALPVLAFMGLACHTRRRS